MTYGNREPKADVVIHFHGSIILFDPLSQRAKAWIDEHTDEKTRQLWVDSLVCEPRFAFDFAKGMVKDGLTIQPGLNERGEVVTVPTW